MALWNRMKINARLMMIVLGTVVGFVVIGGFSLYEIRDNLFEDRKVKTQHVVDTATGILEFYAAETQAGRMTLADAQETAKKAVSTLRYGGNQYFWISTLDGIMVMHPIVKELIGKDLTGDVDANGKAYNVEMIAKAKQGGGFVDYWYPKPGAQEASPKISYVKSLPSWNWYVGSGIYVDDVDAIFMEVLTIVGGVALAILLLVVGVSMIISRGITRPLSDISGNMQRLAEGDKSIEVRSPTRRTRSATCRGPWTCSSPRPSRWTGCARKTRRTSAVPRKTSVR